MFFELKVVRKVSDHRCETEKKIIPHGWEGILQGNFYESQSKESAPKRVRRGANTELNAKMKKLQNAVGRYVWSYFLVR